MRKTTILTICAVILVTAQTRPLQSNDVPAETQGDKSKEEASQILFGERGILTGIFRMMDQQKKIQTASVQQDTGDNGKIGNFDFKKIVDTLVTGAAAKGELGDHGVELPEFLGICNRLSCGDIYKAIDKFRKSEMFSNFQTALTLVNDPNGWETIGKLLSNPELISQFTAGSGMEELFGSALGEVKKESNITKSKNSKLMPEDGDFGIDFSEDGEGQNVTKKDDKDPKVEFSIDMNKGGSEDYYSEVVKAGDESTEYETVDETPPPSTKITKSVDIDLKEKLPPISFSIDEGGDEKETETIETAELPPPNTRILKRIHAGGNVELKKPETGAPPVSLARVSQTLPASSSSPSFSTSKLYFSTSYTTSSSTPATLVNRPFIHTRPFHTSSTTTTTTTTKRPIYTTRARISTTPRPTTTTKNFRKDNDYYVMYYDDGDKL